MRNLYREFRALIPDAPLQVGEVMQVDASGTGMLTVQLPGGSLIRVRGNAATVAIGQKVFVRNDVLEAAAPNLSLEIIEI